MRRTRGRQPNPASKVDLLQTGLLALGSSGPWEVAIDETLSGPARYFAQIEGPSVYLYFEIPAVKLVEDVLDFLDPRVAATKPATENGTLSVIKNAGVHV